MDLNVKMQQTVHAITARTIILFLHIKEVSHISYDKMSITLRVSYLLAAQNRHKNRSKNTYFSVWKTRKRFFPENLATDFTKTIEFQKSVLIVYHKQHSNTVFVSFCTLYLSSIRCPTTKPSETLKNMLGENKNFVTKERYIITEQDLDKYKKFEDEVFAKLTPADNQTAFILSNDDELLGDHHYLEELYPQCHNFQYFDGQGHRFASIKPIKAQIDRFLS